MKKRLFALLIIMIVAVLAFAGCDKYFTNVDANEYTVTFDVNGGSTIDSVVVNRGGLVTRPATDPTRGYDEFAGWYKDATLTTPWNFESDTVVSDTTIYAKWNDHSHSGGQATCTSGVVCDVCGETYGNPLGHNYVDDEAVAPTCTTTGLTSGYHCTNCDVRVEQLVIDALGHSDKNLDHKCDACETPMGGEHVAASGSHNCSYCGGAISECADADKNHKCDVCETAMGTHEAASGSHICAYCGDVVSECADADKNHKCDVCEAPMGGEHVAASGSHSCSYCGEKLTECVDTNPCDHECDICGLNVTVCVDENKNHKCDICDDVMSRCADDDHNHFCDWCGVQNSHCINIDPAVDHKCDWCGAVVDACVDVNPCDHECDICGLNVSNCVDENKNHKCDICDDVMSRCADDDHNHFCDWCGVQNSHCINIDPAVDHKCDWCGAVVNACVDVDPCDHECDVCGLNVSDCVDENKNHKCDICDDVMSRCTDNDHNHFCDYCGVQNSHCINLDPTVDHTCDWCGAKVDECVDVDPRDHECDVCGLEVSVCIDENKNHKCDICDDVMSRCADDDHNHFCDWCGVQNSHCMDLPPYDHNCDWCGERVSECESYAVIDEAVAPTCTATGLTEGSHCSICNKVLVAQQVVAASGHRWTDATCETPKTCSVCNTTEGNANGHTAGTAVVENQVEATCTSGGSYDSVVYCSVCHVELSRTTESTSALGHNMSDWVEVIAPTYEKEGREVRTCSRCDHSETRVVAMLIHTFGAWIQTQAPTCTEEGREVRTCTEEGCTVTEVRPIRANGHTHGPAATCTANQICTVCDAVLTPATGHTKADAVVENHTDSTCSREGSYDTVIYCTVCDAEVSRVTSTIAKKEHTPGAAATCTANQVCTVCDAVLVTAPGHTVVVDAAVAPTCTATGLTEGSHCSVCNEVLVAQEVVAAKGHTVVVDAAVAATCTTAGKTEGKHCSVCNEVLVAQEVVAAKGHTVVVDAAVAATCTTAGKTEGKHCSVCNEVLVAQETVDALGHTEVVDAAVAATCTTAGKTEGKHCSVCNEVLVAQETVDALGHTHAAAVEENRVNSTCTVEGSYDSVVYCSVCNTELSRETKALPLAAHTPGAEASCTAAQTCTSCGAELAEKLPHNMGAPIIYVSFTSNGYERRVCSVCGTSELSETEKSKNYTLSFGTNGTYHNTVVEGIDLSHVQIGDNAGNNSQVKNGYITVTLKADGILTIHGYDGYTVYSISDGTTEEVITDSTYRYVATEDVTLTIVADPDGTGRNYFYSLDINYPTIIKTNTTIDLSATGGTHIEGTTGTYEGLTIDATHGKFSDNGGGWVQVNAGTLITFNVLNRAEVSLVAYSSVDNFDISIVDGVCTITATGNDYLKSITVNYPIVIEENTVIDLSATGVAIEGSKGVYEGLYIDATSGKFTDNNGGWTQVNAGTIITINVLDGARVYIKAYTSVENFEIVVANGVCTITVNANDYLKHIVVEYEHSYDEGTVTAPTCTTAGYTTYTCELCGHSYDGDVTEKAAHTAGEAATENVVAATCTEAGSYDKVFYCTVCDAEISRETVTVPATGHKDADGNGACDSCGYRLPVEKTSTLTFDANKANRVSFSTTSQVWSANGITLTNNKGASTNAVADYANPVRLYKSSEVIIEATGMTKIVFKCSGSDYVLKLTSTSEYTVSTSGTTVTVTFTSPVDSFKVSSLANQTRFSSIDVTTLTEAPTLESISAEGMNTTYTVGDELSLEGLVVKATLSDGTIKTLEAGSYTIDTSAVNSAAAGTYTIVISYNDGFDTREVEITVEYKAASVTGITVSDMKTAYYTGETLNTNATITATYSDGTTGTLALTEFDIDVSAVNNKVGGTYNVVFTYINDETITYTVQVTYTERTLTEVIALADGTAVVVTGTVARIETAYSTEYGNISVYLSDDNGNQLYLYRLTGNVTVGQIIRVSGTITTYGGARQIAQGATFEVVGTHECSKWTDATCSAPAKCIVCSKANGEALPHTPGAEATCEEDQICTVCEIVLVEALGHDYIDGVCNNCGEEEPSEGEEPGVIAGGRDNFNTITANSSYASRKTTGNIWSATNAAVIQGGTSDNNPTFKFIGSTNTVKAIVLNGKTSAYGVLTSTTLTTGISKLSFNYGLPFGDTKIGLKVTITEVATGKTYTKTISNTSATKFAVYTFEWELETPIVGEFTIKIENTKPSNSTSNKDRTAIWNLAWDGWGYES